MKKETLSAKLGRGKVTPEQCAAEVMETIPILLRYFRRQMRAVGAAELSVPQFRALAFLDRFPGASLKDLAEHLGVTKATASATIDRLVQREFVERLEHPKKRRYVMLYLMPAGESLLEEARKAVRGDIALLLESLPASEVENLAEAMVVMRGIFKEVSG